MSKQKTIVAISGSLRKNSSNETILKFIKEQSQEIHIDTSLRLEDLPHFDPNLEENEIPEMVRRFISAITAADGIIICTPEYVFSLPAVLKNALEWTVSTMVFQNKPTCLIVASASGEKALESLELIMKTLGSVLSTNSKLLIQGVKAKVKDQEVTDEPTRKKIKELLGSLISNIK